MKNLNVKTFYKLIRKHEMYKLSIFIAATLYCFTFYAFGMELKAQDSDESIKIVEVKKIWDAGDHNAFTDLIRFQGRWYCTFREGNSHAPGGNPKAENGKIRIIASSDGDSWESVGLLSEPGVDLRDPKLSITPENKLMIIMGGSLYGDSYDGATGKVHVNRLITAHSRVSFSAKGTDWSEVQPIEASGGGWPAGEWLWRVTWHKGRAWGVALNLLDWQNNPLKLYTSADGRHYRLNAVMTIPGNEVTLRFLEDDTMIALCRQGGGTGEAWIGTSQPPYTQWTWRSTENRIGGPNFIILPNGRMWAGGRYYGGKKNQTAIGPMSLNSYSPELIFPSGGDNSYPGFVWYQNLLWMSYYSSHEGKSSIYLAKVKIER